MSHLNYQCDNLTDYRLDNNVSHAMLDIHCFSQFTMQYGKGNPVWRDRSIAAKHKVRELVGLSNQA